LLAIRSPSPWAARPASAAASSKDADFTGSGRLPSTSAPYSVIHAFACASRLRAPRRDHEETIAGGAETLPATSRSRCSRARGFHHCEPAPAPLHLPSLPGGRAGWLDPRAPRGRGPCAAHRLLQSKQPASTTTGSSDPRFTEHPRACACALRPTGSFRSQELEPPPCPRLAPGTWLSLRGIEASALIPEAHASWPRLSPRSSAAGGIASPFFEEHPWILRPRAPSEKSAATTNRGFTGQGPAAFAVDTSITSCPEAGARGSFAPTRSARTPHVVASLRHRRETPVLPAIPPRAASPVLPRRSSEIRRTQGAFHRRTGSPVAAPPKRHCPCRESALVGPTLTGDPELSTTCHQDVENTGASRHSSAFCAPARSVALDGAAAARSGSRLR